MAGKGIGSVNWNQLMDFLSGVAGSNWASPAGASASSRGKAIGVAAGWRPPPRPAQLLAVHQAVRQRPQAAPPSLTELTDQLLAKKPPKPKGTPAFILPPVPSGGGGKQGNNNLPSGAGLASSGYVVIGGRAHFLNETNGQLTIDGVKVGPTKASGQSSKGGISIYDPSGATPVYFDGDESEVFRQVGKDPNAAFLIAAIQDQMQAANYLSSTAHITPGNPDSATIAAMKRVMGVANGLGISWQEALGVNMLGVNGAPTGPGAATAPDTSGGAATDTSGASASSSGVFDPTLGSASSGGGGGGSVSTSSSRSSGGTGVPTVAGGGVTAGAAPVALPDATDVAAIGDQDAAQILGRNLSDAQQGGLQQQIDALVQAHDDALAKGQINTSFDVQTEMDKLMRQAFPGEAAVHDYLGAFDTFAAMLGAGGKTQTVNTFGHANTGIGT
jgi:hypothetical protein